MSDLSEFQAQSPDGLGHGANDEEMLDALASEVIAHVFQESSAVVIVLQSGYALVLSGVQSYWLDSQQSAAERSSSHADKLESRRQVLEARLAKMR